MDLPNKTAVDAHVRITEARMGSLVSPTLVYIRALRNELRDWMIRLDMEERAMIIAEEQERKHSEE